MQGADHPGQLRGEGDEPGPRQRRGTGAGHSASLPDHAAQRHLPAGARQDEGARMRPSGASFGSLRTEAAAARLMDHTVVSRFLAWPFGLDELPSTGCLRYRGCWGYRRELAPSTLGSIEEGPAGL